MTYHSDFDAHLDNYGDPDPSGAGDNRDRAEEAWNQRLGETGDGEAGVTACFVFRVPVPEGTVVSGSSALAALRRVTDLPWEQVRPMVSLRPGFSSGLQ